VKRALVLLLLASAPAGAARYGREALLERARVAHPAIAAARQTLKSARIGLTQAQLGWAPIGDLSLTLAGTPEIRCYQNSPGEIATVPQTLREQNCLNTNYVDWLRAGAGNGAWNATPFHGLQVAVALVVQQPLWSFGKTEAQIESARALIAGAEQSLRSAVAEAQLGALRAWLGIKWARSGLAVLDEEVAKLKDWQRAIEGDMEGKNAVGYSEADLARIKVQVDSAEIQRLDVERRLETNRALLRVALNDPAADVDDGELVLLGDGRTVEQWQAQAVRQRPEVKQLDVAVRLAEADRRGRLADLLPDLALQTTLNYSYASAEDTPLNYFFLRNTMLDGSLTLQLHMSMDIGPRYTRLQQAQATRRAAVARREKGLYDIAVEIARAFADHGEARAREARLQRAERVAHGWYAIVDDNLQHGLSVSSDTRELTDAARNYFDFRLRHLQAVLDADLTLAWLERVSGAQ
jgi:outer membrane protein TolC